MAQKAKDLNYKSYKYKKIKMQPNMEIEPEETLTQQKTRNTYANLHILHSKHYKLYKDTLNPSTNNVSRHLQILDNEVADLNHKRKKTNQKLMFMEFLKDSKTIILGYDKSSERGDINFIDMSQPKVNDFYYNKLQGGMGGLTVFRDGRFILVADKKGGFTFIDMFQGPNIDDIKNKSIQTPYEGVMDLALSPAQNKVVLGLADKKCVVIDIESQRHQKIFPLCKTFEKHTFGVNSVDWHPYKSLILSSSKDINDTLKLWDPNNQELIQDSNFHKNSIVTQCQFHPEGNTYFSLGKDNSILEYELRYKGILNRFYLPAEPTSMAVMSNGNIVVGDGSGYLTWFTSCGEVIKSQKGASAVVCLKIDDTSNLLIVARERQHTFQIFTKNSIFQLNDF